MGRAKSVEKWALISWNSLTKIKEAGGLGVRDPLLLNQVLVTKLWWHWVKGGKDLWKEIWTQKYSMPTIAGGIMRKEEMPKGSTIWNLACQNRDIINTHAFWEVRNGRITKF